MASSGFMARILGGQATLTNHERTVKFGKKPGICSFGPAMSHSTGTYDAAWTVSDSFPASVVPPGAPDRCVRVVLADATHQDYSALGMLDDSVAWGDYGGL